MKKNYDVAETLPLTLTLEILNQWLEAINECNVHNICLRKFYILKMFFFLFLFNLTPTFVRMSCLNIRGFNLRGIFIECYICAIKKQQQKLEEEFVG